MKTVLLATALTLTSVPAWSCGLLGLVFNPDCKPVNELLAQDMATCRAQKLEMNSCLAYLQNARSTRLIAHQRAMQRAADALGDAADAIQPHGSNCYAYGNSINCRHY